MKPSKPILGYASITVLATCILLAFGNFCFAQTTSSNSKTAAEMFDEYGDLDTDSEAGRLDLFAESLFKQPELRGYVIAYSEPQMERGYYLRRIYSVRNYFINFRGIEPERIAVIDGGYKKKFTTQLWYVAEGVIPPTPASTVAQPRAETLAAYRFDNECLECSPAVPFHLYGLGEGLKFYADALKENSRLRGLIVVRAGEYTNAREALNRAQKAKRELAKKYGINSKRISVKLARSNDDNLATAEMWIVPR